MADMGYTYKKLDTPDEELELHHIPSETKTPGPSNREQLGSEELTHRGILTRSSSKSRTIVIAMSGLMIVAVLALVAVVRSAVLEPRATPTSSTEDVPQYFQTTPEIFAGRI